MDGTVEALNTIAKVIVEHGTTSFLPTTMTVSIEDINKAMKVIKKLKEEGTEGANVSTERRRCSCRQIWPV